MVASFREDGDREVTKDGKANNHEKETQRLVEVLGEILFLRDRLASLEAEAELLKEELGR